MVPFQAMAACECLTEEHVRRASLGGKEAKFPTQGELLQWRKFAEGIFRKRYKEAQR